MSPAHGTSSAAQRQNSLLHEDSDMWTDITDEFKDTCSALNVGELCRDEGFGLYEAMSAIEMMDPKMDAGLSAAAQLRAAHFSSEAEGDIVTSRLLTVSEQVRVMSTTFRCVATWLEGHSLAQTVFINKFLHKPTEVVDPLMRTFSLTTLRTVSLIRDLLNATVVYEEEDFQPLLHGFKLAPTFRIETETESPEEQGTDNEAARDSTGTDDEVHAVDQAKGSSFECSDSSKGSDLKKGGGSASVDIGSPTTGKNGSKKAMSGDTYMYAWSLHSITAAIKDADEEIAKRLRQARQRRDTATATAKKNETPCGKTASAAVGKPGTDSSDSKDDNDEDLLDTEYEDLLALQAHVKLSRSLFLTFSLTVKPGDKSASSQSGMAHVKTSTELCPVDPADLKKLLQKLRVAVDSLQTGPAANRPYLSEDVGNTPGFDPMCTHRALPPSFPRHTPVATRQTSATFFSDLVTHLEEAATVREAVSVAPGETSTHDLLRVLNFFAAFSQRAPNIVARSLLMHMYLPPPTIPINTVTGIPQGGFSLGPTGASAALVKGPVGGIGQRMFGVVPAIDIIIETLRAFTQPPALSFLPRGARGVDPKGEGIPSLLLSFLISAARPLCALFSIASNNRARQRDKLAMVLEDLSILQAEADKMDAYIDQFLGLRPNAMTRQALGAWTLTYVLRAMIEYLLLGFELSLYSVHEYRYIYCYLSEILYLWLVSALARADTCITEHKRDGGNDQSGSSGSAGKKGKKHHRKGCKGGGGSGAGSGASVGGGGSGPTPHTQRVLIARVCQQLAAGYFNLLVALELTGALVSPTYEFDHEETRYSHRFGPFASVMTPTPMTFAQYSLCVIRAESGGRQDKSRISGVFVNAYQCFEKAGAMLEIIGRGGAALPTTWGVTFACHPAASDAKAGGDEVKMLLRLVKTNMVATKALAGEFDRGVIRMPSFEFSVSKFFPIIKL